LQMSSRQPAVSIRHLSRSYPLVRREDRPQTLKDEIIRRLQNPIQRRNQEQFWALKDVSLEIARGEAVGIIGRNGAGKSTLLKILSRITEPTHGEVLLYGRVGSLLEVGTGFHPELTGRENIYLCGSIMGMRSSEIQRQLEAIVDFAEIDRFLETPVKRYSSGMYTRLAFAIAAHLEPEILLVDEVLAVGDTSFQKKCLAKMGELWRAQRTVVFVSHDMTAVTRLCGRAIVFEAGRVVFDGAPTDAVDQYLRSGAGPAAEREWNEAPDTPDNQFVRLRRARVRNQAGETIAGADIREPVGIEIAYEVLEGASVLAPHVYLTDAGGVAVCSAIDQDHAWRRRNRTPGHYVSTAWFPGNFFAEGQLVVSIGISTLDPFQVHVWEVDALAFHVVDSLEGDSARGEYGGPLPGVVRPLLNWETDFAPRISAVAGN
jgi:homopolymeric O-antigen transport system ATP-binding protein